MHHAGAVMGTDDTATHDNAAESMASEARKLIERGDLAEAAAMLNAAVAEMGEQAALLWPLAEATFGLLDYDLALDMLDRAAMLESEPATAIGERIKLLSKAGMVREALATVDAVPRELATDPTVREATVDFYRIWGYTHHAARAAEVSQLDPPSSRLGRILDIGWLIFNWGIAWEERELLEPERRVPPSLSELEQASGLTGSSLTYLRARIDVGGVRLRRTNAAGARARAQRFWVILFFLFGLLFSMLFYGTDALPPADRPTVRSDPAGGGALVAVVVVGLMFALLRRRSSWRINTTRRLLLMLLIAVVTGIGALEAFLQQIGPDHGWPQAVAYGLVGVPTATVFAVLIEDIESAGWYYRWRRTTEANAQFTIIDDLLWLLHRLRSTTPRTVSEKLADAKAIEDVALTIRVFLLPHDRLDRLTEKDWLRERAAGWARALRRLERGLVASNPEQAAEVDRALCHAIGCLARGDFGSMEWIEREDSVPAQQKRRRRLMTVVRDLLVALLPIAALWAARETGHVSSGLFNWALLATGAWAVLNLMIVLDPELDRKLTLAGQVTDALRNARSRSDGG